jgi:divalent metal cation (Fe/Co/Zn/Cd) transporter
MMNPTEKAASSLSSCCSASTRADSSVFWLQSITLGWMLLECAISLSAARTAHSPVLLAFGSDSLVELLSATVVLLAAISRFRIAPERASRWAGVLLFALAGIVGLIALLALVKGVSSQTSKLGIAITGAALIVMPMLAWRKRRLAHSTGNRALAADAVQSATCAWLAAATLPGLLTDALFHLRWVDSVAALAVLPILIVEGRRAWRGEACGCC